MKQCKFRSEFIVQEPPKERTRRQFQSILLIVVIIFAGIVSTSYLNYNTQVIGQQIDIASRAINTMKRQQMSKQAKLNELMKFDDILHKAEALGFTGSTSVTQVLSVSPDQFDRRQVAIFNKRPRVEREATVPLYTQRIVKPVVNNN